METNVKQLNTPLTDSQQDTIRLLEEYLEDAKKGNITSVAIVGVTNNQKSTTGASKGINLDVILGGIEILKFRLLTTNYGKFG